MLHPLATTAPLPRRFNNPFDCRPHALCVAAAAEVQTYLAANPQLMQGEAVGKMFGVLVVQSRDGGALAFLAAYSGLLGGRNDWPYFVPPVYDAQQPDGHFKTREREISAMNRCISEAEASDELASARRELASLRDDFSAESARRRALLAQQKAERDRRRQHDASLTQADLDIMIRQSQHAKAEFARWRKAANAQMAEAEARKNAIEQRIALMKSERKAASDELQQWLFAQYRVLNARGDEQSVAQIFALNTAQGMPPAGAGDCCAPKLLQAAYRMGLRPLAIAEFWWGRAPKTEVRRPLQFYPACRGKCGPILQFMLQGLDVEPLAAPDDEVQELEIVYEDDALAVVCKPSGMLSVPGLDGRPSVESIMRRRWQISDAPIIVHRLDMDTSGLLVVARTKAAHKALQEQFLAHSVSKQYVALIEHSPRADGASEHVQWATESAGTISLPLRPDLVDRPRQLVDMANGKPAVTRFALGPEQSSGQRLITLWPLTGRTHQLRVHCAHPLGLNSPIVGDPLYGTRSRRLCLHARSITFVHPTTGQSMTFEREADFGFAGEG